MRAPVETWTTASTIAALASQAFDAMVVEKTDVMMSVYFEATLARKSTVVTRDPKGYDDRVSTPEPGWPLRRIVVLPLVLFAVVSASVFALAKLHLAKPAGVAGPVTLGDPQRGQVIFGETCAGCHGTKAEGGIGPAPAGARTTSSPIWRRYSRCSCRYSGRLVIRTYVTSSSSHLSLSCTMPVLPEPSYATSASRSSSSSNVRLNPASSTCSFHSRYASSSPDSQ